MMKLPISCMECFKENGIPNFTVQTVEINNDFYFITTCNKGHTTMTILQEERFEILFDFACSAFLDEYYRDAVTNAAAAIERMHEFFIKVIVINKLIKSTNERGKVLEDKIQSFDDNVWKWMSKQSERQLGAFYLAYFNTFNIGVPNFVEKHVEFRNKTIHKGYIPSREEAKDYLVGVFDYMLAVLTPLKKNFMDSIITLTMWNLKTIQETGAKKTEYPVSTMANSSVINLVSGEAGWGNRSFEDELRTFSEKNEKMELFGGCFKSGSIKEAVTSNVKSR